MLKFLAGLLSRPTTPVVYSPEDVEHAFGVSYTSWQRQTLKDIPFSNDVLKACAGTHMLFPGFGLSLMDIHDKNADLFYSKTGGWYSAEKHVFSRVPVPLQWHLLRTTPVPDSFRKTWDEQQALLLPDEEMPSAATVVFATMLHFMARRVRLFRSCCVRTSDVDFYGVRVNVGLFDAGGFVVSSDWDAGRYGDLGVSSAQKF